ncbi:GspE/PulE family protein [Stutzerimonas stutzeri]|uniref:GspE/PulE family protein n=1 Tax=Stutzerimonas stutzeri TaxID=316 RepID=UPI00265CCF08|nr:ATPase, T2SS/T4P/T4SS family [Stutzerimonas stutzeri]MCF6783440.1 Flp pilus assembly complex ATPase component TadA [Stutzerimonas stutzeri]
MNAIAQNQLTGLIRRWGFGTVANQFLLEHAEHVLRLRGARAGTIVVELGIAKKEEIEGLLANKPSGKTKTLEYLIECGVRGLSSSIDRIMAIQNGVAYISKSFRELTLHPELLKKERRSVIEGELTRWGMLPMVCGDNLLLMFDDFSKMVEFRAQGKNEKMTSALFLALADVMGTRPEQAQFNTILARNSVLLEYQQRVSDSAAGVESSEEGLQTIDQSEADSDPTIAQVVRILNEALQQEINDIAIVPDRRTASGRVFFRKYQKLINSGIVLNPIERDALTRILMARSRANPSGGRLRHPVDGNANFEGKLGQAFLRLSFIPLEESQFPSTSVSIRLLPRAARNIELADLNIDINLQNELHYFTRRKYGLFVVCGPTGSGKSTTIAGMLCEHDKIYGETLKRVSVEQPCERILPNVLHIDVSQHRYNENERGSDTDNFGMALRSILRHDPDVVYVGEVRDKESCMVSVDASNTGHLVFTTTHANDPVLGYRRLASFLDPDRRFDLVNVLEGILAQRLLTTVCEHCSEEMAFDEACEAALSRYASIKGIDLTKYTIPSTYRLANKQGCSHCIEGNSGMIPVHGLLTFNPKVRELLLSPNEKDWMLAEAASDSPYTLFGSAFKLFEAGLIDLETVML